MTLTVDCNIDKLFIDGIEIPLKIHHPADLVAVLTYIFDAMEPDGLSLVMINEDKRLTVGEW